MDNPGSPERPSPDLLSHRIETLAKNFELLIEKGSAIDLQVGTQEFAGFGRRAPFIDRASNELLIIDEASTVGQSETGTGAERLAKTLVLHQFQKTEEGMFFVKWQIETDAKGALTAASKDSGFATVEELESYKYSSLEDIAGTGEDKLSQLEARAAADRKAESDLLLNDINDDDVKVLNEVLARFQLRGEYIDI
jgi:hypothetical protein